MENVSKSGDTQTHIDVSWEPSYRPVLQVHGLGQEVDPDRGLLGTEKDTSSTAARKLPNQSAELIPFHC